MIGVGSSQRPLQFADEISARRLRRRKRGARRRSRSLLLSASPDARNKPITEPAQHLRPRLQFTAIPPQIRSSTPVGARPLPSVHQRKRNAALALVSAQGCFSFSAARSPVAFASASHIYVPCFVVP